MIQETLPQIGDYFRNQDKTEIYKVTLSGKSLIWVTVLDFKNDRLWRGRPYSTIGFLKEMIPITRDEVASYGKGKIIMVQSYMDEIFNF